MDSIIHRLDNCNFFTDPLFSLYGSLSARMKIKTAGNLLPVCAWERGKGKEKIVLFFSFSRSALVLALAVLACASIFKNK